MQNVIRHARDERGWTRAKFAPIDSSTWDKFDRQWIQWLREHDQDVVTVGDTMYEIVKDQGE